MHLEPLIHGAGHEAGRQDSKQVMDEQLPPMLAEKSYGTPSAFSLRAGWLGTPPEAGALLRRGPPNLLISSMTVAASGAAIIMRCRMLAKRQLCRPVVSRICKPKASPDGTVMPHCSKTTKLKEE